MLVPGPWFVALAPKGQTDCGSVMLSKLGRPVNNKSKRVSNNGEMSDSTVNSRLTPG